MDNKKLLIAGVVLVGLVGIAAVALQGRDGEAPEDTSAAFPDFDRDDITGFRVRHSVDEDTDVRFAREGDTWRIVEPIEFAVDEGAIDSAIDKLAELEVVRTVATSANSHETLEVTPEAGIEVTVSREGEGDVVFLIGATRNGNSIVRLDGEDESLQVNGSLRFAFAKTLTDFRDRQISEVSSDRVRTMRFESDQGVFSFWREAGGDWIADEVRVTEAPSDGDAEETSITEIERYGTSRVQSVLTRIASLRATDFAAEDVSAESAGLVPPVSVVRLGLAPEGEEAGNEDDGDGEESEAEDSDEEPAEPAQRPVGYDSLEQVVFELGGEAEGQDRHVRVAGNPVIYVVSEFVSDRLRPSIDMFQNPEPGEEPAGMEGMGGMPGAMGMPGGMPGMPGGGQLPPEVMEQIRQMQAQNQ